MESKQFQPKFKSFENYIKLGFEFNNKEMTLEQKNILNKISKLDTSVLILDDILDKSEQRNNKPCLYKKIGKNKAIVQAKIFEKEAINYLIKLMEISNTNLQNKFKILVKINKFLENIYLGQKIDLELENYKNFNEDLIKRYFEMISLFTANHIKFGFEIGRLLANKKIDKNLSHILENIGRIRQILDDYNDYFQSHHEIFGDLKNSNNRLPELLFKKFNKRANQTKTKEKISKLLKNKEYFKLRKLILNTKVKKELYKYCQKEFKNCQKIKTQFNYLPLIEDFNKILN